ncbi:hypothetical protein HanXRQr2_Chr13g0565771 [Helianthus annuus]|uniref:Uncharacterized protein n=1 Tax=Helianthus annuus TaxID=4232 RepID=A0A251SML5_HELAN|nr:hypothetical protein HanXRQr2_Chr13g0565771 [Helianthus annuus]
MLPPLMNSILLVVSLLLYHHFDLRCYNSLPPISKVYGTLCLLTISAVSLKSLATYYNALLHAEVFYRFQDFMVGDKEDKVIRK